MACGTITPLLTGIQLAEGPHWDAEKQKLFLVDMIAGIIHCYDPVTKEDYKATVGPTGTFITMIVPIEGTKDKFIVGMNGDLAIITWDCKSPVVTDIHKYISLETDADVRTNDGKTSPSGMVFVGSMAYKLPDGTLPPGRGNLFAIDSRGEKPKAINLLKPLGAVVDVSNGICWNEDETIFYWADTLQKKLYKFDYNKETLTISNQRVLLDYDKENLKGFPDGMTIDKCGTIFLASVDGGGELLRVDAKTGEVMDHIEFPGVSDVSSAAFGGANLEDLYVTSINRKTEPLSGSLFVLKGHGTSGYPGVPAKIRL